MAVRDQIPEKASPNDCEGLELDCMMNNLIHRGKLENGEFYCRASVLFSELGQEPPTKFCKYHGIQSFSKDNKEGFYKCNIKEL